MYAYNLRGKLKMVAFTSDFRPVKPRFSFPISDLYFHKLLSTTDSKLLADIDLSIKVG